MLKLEEKRILHGVYVDHPAINDGIVYTVRELAWLANNPYERAASWRNADGSRKSIGEKLRDRDLAIAIALTRRAINHLEGAALIGENLPESTWTQRRIRITYQGAIVARSLETCHGRAGLWYREHKDGIAGLLITVAVSMATTIATLLIKHRWF